ncbi:MAG: T9SS type A sorting domain-containing protein [Bacteroidetes bacterium]|nr:MAG: T9SS type A sorting domain-containing protein [Bacteroidota bacterium]
MKKHLLSFTLIAAFSIAVLNSVAQGLHPVSGESLKYCGQAEAAEELYKQYPNLKEAAEIIENLQKNQNENPVPNQQPPPVYTIPVVFHILHNYGPENIPDANVIDAMRVLNEDFRKLNTDISTVVPAFQGITGDAEIEFKLAKLDPNGNCTNGIDRIVTPKTYAAGDGQNGSNVSKINMWPRDKYLNIYTVNNIKSGAAGYTYVPGTVASNPAIDGIIILYNYVGALSPSSVLTSRSLGHEVGHWLDLQHVWGGPPTYSKDPGLICGDDGVTDTPVTKGWTTCNLTTNDVCTGGVEENVQNYMDYSYCYRMFTAGQCSRMRSALLSSTAQRSNLSTTGNLLATGVSTAAQLCKADFTVNKKIVCLGTAITFTDISGSVTPTSWQWDFNNDGTTDATTQNPSYTFATPGTYSVKLTASDGTTTKTVTKSSLIVVLGTGPTTNVPYSEGFENASFPYNDFYITSASAGPVTWNRVTTAAYTGSASLKLDNHSPTTGDIDEFITPSINMSNVTSPTMTFRVAHQRRSSSDTLDGMRVFTSSNCGTAWVMKYNKDFSTLQTVTNVSSTAFTPNLASQWRQETINISSSAGMPELRFKFEFTGHGVGNNLYIDDINISGTASVEEEFNNDFGLNVFPNPFDENTTISFHIQDKYEVALGVYDIIGKEIVSISNSIELSPGFYSLPLNKSNLKQGIYFVRLEVNGYSVMKKVAVQ